MTPPPPSPLQAVTRRADFDTASCASGALTAGDAAIATSSRLRCTVVQIDYTNDTCTKGTCTLEFESEGIRRTQAFESIGNDPGGARLHRAVPNLRPGPRVMRGDEKAEKARPKVDELFNAEGARSPSMRDVVRRRVGGGLYQTAQALVIYAKRSALYALYMVRYPSHQISFSLFKKLAPW